MRELRRHGPIVAVALWNGQRAWLVTRLAEARQALTEPGLSADANDPNFPLLNTVQGTSNRQRGVARLDNDRHAVVRGLLAGSSTARAGRRWRRTAQQIAADQLAMMLRNGPPADFVTEFAQPVPLRLMCSMLGVTGQDMELIERAAPGTVTRARRSIEPAVAELRLFIEELVRYNELAPRDGLIGRLVAECLRAGAITREELLDTLLILMVAGHLTTAGTISLSRAIQESPGLVVPMVEEFLRLQTVVSDGVPRVAKRDLVLAGTSVRAGDAVVTALASANRDEAVFAGPNEFQPDSMSCWSPGRPQDRTHQKGSPDGEARIARRSAGDIGRTSACRLAAGRLSCRARRHCRAAEHRYLH